MKHEGVCGFLLCVYPVTIASNLVLCIVLLSDVILPCSAGPAGGGATFRKIKLDLYATCIFLNKT